MTFPVKIVDALPPHHPFILNSWINGLGALDPWRELDPNWFAAAQHSLITRLLDLPHTAAVVAANPEDYDQIFGYAVGNRSLRVLHWIYTKKRFRGQGIGEAMMRALFGRPGEPIEITTWAPPLQQLASWGLTKRTHRLCEAIQDD